MEKLEELGDLRDHFAGLAMLGILNNVATQELGNLASRGFAQLAYDFADDMLRQRAFPPKQVNADA